MSLQKKPLGKSGLEIAPLVFGGNVFGWTADDNRSFQLLDRFVEQGFSAIDTADVYSAWAPGLEGGESEAVIGRWLKKRGRRDDVILMSKVGMLERRKGLSAANIEAAIEDSLSRLGTDYLDVYFAHIDDQEVPLEETLGAFDRLIKAGKVRAIGASNYSSDRLEQALAVSRDHGFARYELIQPLYNLHDRADFESSQAQGPPEHQLGGFLTGKYAQLSDLEGNPRADFLNGYFSDRGQRILDTLMAVSQEASAKPSQVALAWLLHQPELTAPIVSATSLSQLDEILASVKLSLPEEMLSRLDAASRQ